MYILQGACYYAIMLLLLLCYYLCIILCRECMLLCYYAIVKCNNIILQRMHAIYAIKLLMYNTAESACYC